MLKIGKTLTKVHYITVLIAVGLLASLLAGCGPKAVTIDAYVGDGMIIPMQAVKAAYEAQNPNVTIKYSFAGSGTLEETIRSLERGDVYMPGATKYIDNLNEDGLIVSRYPVAFHVPAILIREGDTTVTSWDDLANEGVRLAIANPELASIGRTSDSIISKSPLNDQIRTNITALGADTRSIIDLLLANEVDAVISWRSASATAPGLAVVVIPEDINDIKEIWIAVPTFTTQESEARDFAQFAAGAEGKQAFTDAGFLTFED